MINNYLDYVKRQRKAALKAARDYSRRSRLTVSAWGNGFYSGHVQARRHEARHWRTLQKDIEIRQARGGEIAEVIDFNNLFLTKLT